MIYQSRRVFGDIASSEWEDLDGVYNIKDLQAFLDQVVEDGRLLNLHSMVPMSGCSESVEIWTEGYGKVKYLGCHLGHMQGFQFRKKPSSVWPEGHKKTVDELIEAMYPMRFPDQEL